MTKRAHIFFGFVLALSATASGAAHAEKLEIWIRGFIPKSIPGTPDYVRAVPGQPDHWMIPGPGIPYVSNGPLPWVGSCYNTNDRDFTSARDAESKVASSVTVTLSDGPAASSINAPKVAKTRQFDCETGKVTCEKSVDLSAVNTSAPRIVGKTVEIDLDADAENACIPLVEWTPSQIVPSIKWHGKLIINPGRGLITFRGTVAEFPAYEAYVSVDGGPPITLMTESPSAGATVWSLAKNRVVEKSVNYYSLAGTWQSSDPGKRFRLVCTTLQCEWTENSGANSLTRTVMVEPLPDGTGYRLHRANLDAQLLTFLGFAPAIQTEILSRGPQASFIDLRFNSGALSASWNGILVIKDAQGKFKELRQPGSSPAKPYRFERQS